MEKWTYHVKTEQESECKECRDGSDLRTGYICDACGAIGYKPDDIELAEREVNEMAVCGF